jgi:protein-serine/threonine kinase
VSMSGISQSDLAGKARNDLVASDQTSLPQQARHDSKVHHDVGTTLDHSDSPTDALRANSHPAANNAQTSGGAAAPLTDTNKTAYAYNHAILPTIDTGVNHSPLAHRVSSIPALAGLTIQTDLDTPGSMLLDKTKDTPSISETPVPTRPNNSLASPPAYNLPARGSSLRSNLSTASISSSLSPGSANSALPSPYLATMSDLTPLPSPLVGHEAPWKRTRPRTPGHSRNASLEEPTPTNALSPTIASPGTPSKRKKGYGSLVSTAVETSMAINTGVTQENRKQTGRHHSRNRSISDFQPEQLHNVRQRHVTIGAGDAPGFEAAEYRMQREAYLAAQRGLTQDPRAPKQIPSPPPSNTSVAESDEHEEDTDTIALNANGEPAEYLQIHCGINNRKRKFRKLRQLGQGTFSKVVLATSERILENPAPANVEEQLDPARLVAVKIVEHGPAGGADKERIDTSLRREVEMLKNISHPSLVHLKACEHQESRTLLVLTYCSGGDLFEVASSQREVLTPPMVQRMFSELVSAVRYLHTNWIVHRDIKLENVLVNFPPAKLAEISNPLSFPEPIVTLTDLGLSRRIPDPPESPLLTTRCGSEDYAAPEILLGQPYDGRHTDAWALGVLLYALMEGRLPFDAPPNKPERSRNTHRIARCDWIWCRFGDEDGEWDSNRGGDWDGARECVEGLLKKVRMGRRPLEDIEGLDWVKHGIAVPGGLQMREEDRGEMN